MQTVTPLNSKVQLIDSGQKFISNESRIKIENEWQKLVTLYPRMFNGPIYSADKIEETSESIALTCSLTDYAHYKYSEHHDLMDEACKNVYGSCLVVTKDNYVVVSMNGNGSEFTEKIQAIGGGVEIWNSIETVRPGFLLTDGRKFGIVTIGISFLSKSEMKNAFERFQKESGNDSEIF